MTHSTAENEISYSALKIVSDNMTELIYVSIPDTKELVFVNRALADTLAVTPDFLIGKNCCKTIGDKMGGICETCPIDELPREERRAIKTSRLSEFRSAASGKWYLVQDAVIEWEDGRDACMRTATEITSRKEYEQQLKQKASTDSLTGVINRDRGYDLLHMTLEYADHPLRDMSLVFIDVDGLKQINDTFGHDCGDETLVKIVEFINSGTRKNDVLFRWGGDEFILLLECAVDSAKNIVDGIQKKLVEFNATKTLPYDLAFSCGIVEFALTDDLSTPEKIIAVADAAMYENKISKRI
ncbi:MAG: GGDEF domain-containing protein [Oscillospiraceae bacterium]|nr:GGDEF domain-containing protein [Oscillospiraceae bacterium]